jgi:hypothetical protein
LYGRVRERWRKGERDARSCDSAHGGILTRDAGSITYKVSFDEDDNFTGLEVVAVHGPHPGFFEDPFCSTVVPALGL